MSALLEVRNLTKTFNTGHDLLGRVNARFTAVDDVSFDLQRGETLAVVGESGAGKSTVGRLVLRLVEPTAGTITYEGQDLLAVKGEELRKLRGKMRMIFQDPFSSLDPRMVIAEVLSEPLRIHTELPRSDRHERAVALLERVGLREEHTDRFPYEFSGGQLQRIAIARAIATEPDLIVCDEPVAALDMSIRAQVINLMRELQVERRLAYLFITHDLSLVQLIADRVVVMYRGRIVEAATTEQLFADPRHPYTRQLLAAVPVPDPDRRHRPKAVALRPALPEAGDGGCAYAPRCSDAVDACTTTVPPLLSLGSQDVACIRAEESDRVSAELLVGAIRS